MQLVGQFPDLVISQPLAARRLVVEDLQRRDLVALASRNVRNDVTFASRPRDRIRQASLDRC